jgi:hypothetical protein
MAAVVLCLSSSRVLGLALAGCSLWSASRAPDSGEGSAPNLSRSLQRSPHYFLGFKARAVDRPANHDMPARRRRKISSTPMAFRERM